MKLSDVLWWTRQLRRKQLNFPRDTYVPDIFLSPPRDDGSKLQAETNMEFMGIILSSIKCLEPGVSLHEAGLTTSQRPSTPSTHPPSSNASAAGVQSRYRKRCVRYHISSHAASRYRPLRAPTTLTYATKYCWASAVCCHEGSESIVGSFLKHP